MPDSSIVHEPLPPVKMSVNTLALTTKPSGGDPIFARMASSWQVEDVTPSDLEYFILRGRAFTAHLTGTERRSEHFCDIQHVCLDFDHGLLSDPQRLSEDDFVQHYASLIYTSPSHTPEEPRCRAVFFLSEPMADAEEYALCMRGLLSMYPDADPIVDAVRMWFGNPRADIYRLPDGNGELPVDVFRNLGAAYERAEDLKRKVASTLQAPGSDPLLYHGKLGPMLVEDVRTAPQGSRNTTLYVKCVKARERMPIRDASYWIDRMVEAAIESGLSEREALRTKASALRGV